MREGEFHPVEILLLLVVGAYLVYALVSITIYNGSTNQWWFISAAILVGLVVVARMSYRQSMDVTRL